MTHERTDSRSSAAGVLGGPAFNAASWPMKLVIPEHVIVYQAVSS
jgi:hypothetical protein